MRKGFIILFCLTFLSCRTKQRASQQADTFRSSQDTLSLTQAEFKEGIRVFRNEALGVQFKYNSFNDLPLESTYDAARYAGRDKWSKHESVPHGIEISYPPELQLREDASYILLGKGNEEPSFSSVTIFRTNESFNAIAHEQHFEYHQYEDSSLSSLVIDSTRWDVLGGIQYSDRDSATLIRGNGFIGLRGSAGTDLVHVVLYFPGQHNDNLVVLYQDVLQVGLAEEYFYYIVESIKFSN